MPITQHAAAPFIVAAGAGTENKTIPGTPVEGDVVFVCLACDNLMTTEGAGLVPAEGYTNLAYPAVQNPAHQIAYKVLGATPDLTLTFEQQATGDIAGVIKVLRGVDPTVFDQTTPSPATGATGLPNPPAITTQTDGAWVLIVGFLDDDINVSPTAPTNYSNLTSEDTPFTGATTMVATREIATAGVEDPGVFGGSGNDEWYAYTIALKPADAAPPVPTGQAIFRLGLETSLTHITTLVTGGGSIIQSPGSALGGTAGGMELQRPTASATAQYAVKTFPVFTTETDIRVRAYKAKNTFAMVDGDYHVILYAFPTTGLHRLLIALAFSTANGFYMLSQVRDDADTSLDSPGARVMGATFNFSRLEAHLHRASNGTGANDGFLKVYFDGVEDTNLTLTGIDLFDKFDLDEIHVGHPFVNSPAGATGTLYWDEIVARDDAYPIGAIGTGTAPVLTVPGAQAGIFGTPLSISGASIVDVDKDCTMLMASCVAGMTITFDVSGLAQITATGNGTNAVVLEGNQLDLNTILGRNISVGRAEAWPTYEVADVLTLTAIDANLNQHQQTIAVNWTPPTSRFKRFTTNIEASIKALDWTPPLDATGLHDGFIEATTSAPLSDDQIFQIDVLGTPPVLTVPGTQQAQYTIEKAITDVSVAHADNLTNSLRFQTPAAMLLNFTLSGGVTAPDNGSSDVLLSGAHAALNTVAATMKANRATPVAPVPSNLVKASANPYSIETNLQESDDVWTDRTNTFVTIPTALLGAAWISTPNDDKASTDPATLAFDLNFPCWVYISRDQRSNETHGLPAWMDGWDDTGEVIITSDPAGNVTHSLFRKSFPAGVGVVSLGGYDFGVLYTHYVVIIQPIAATVPIKVTATDSNGNTDVEAFNVTWESGVETSTIRVTGNGVTIVDGDATPSLADHTDFGTTLSQGSPIDRVFTIHNDGLINLTLGGTPKIAISGAGAGAFSVIAQPSSPVVPAGSTTFTIRFSPQAVAAFDAVVTIENNDEDLNPFTFAITGEGANNPPVITSNGGGATAAVNVQEGTTGVTTVVATDLDNDTLTHNISGGVDAALFSIGSSSGVLVFISAPAHDTPLDANADNIYEVEVTVSDGIDSDSQMISVTVVELGGGGGDGEILIRGRRR